MKWSLLSVLLLLGCREESETYSGGKLKKDIVELEPKLSATPPEDIRLAVPVHATMQQQLAIIQEFSDSDVLLLWDEIMNKKKTSTSGVFPGHPKFKDLLFLNELMDRLVAFQPGEVDDEVLEKVNKLFDGMIFDSSIHNVERDYSIQSAYLWISKSQENPYRSSLLAKIQNDIISVENKDKGFLGTALNTFSALESSWTPEEKNRFHASFQEFVNSSPALHALPNEVSIPVAHAMKKWDLPNYERYFEDAKEKGNPHLLKILHFLSK